MAPRETIPLTQDEIEELYNEFDQDQDGKISFDDVEATLRTVLEELTPEAMRHHLTHPERSTKRLRRWTRALMLWESSSDHSGNVDIREAHDSDLHDFLRRLLPGCKGRIRRRDFCYHVQSWNIPSQNQPSAEDEVQQARKYERKLPFGRRWKAYWSVKGPEVAFLAFVGASIVGCSLWQGLKYALNVQARAAFSYGLVVAKFCAGAMYPTFFFMILSMSRWFATFCRKSYLVSRFINWDLSRTFHIRLSCLALFLSLAHALSHLTGTFYFASSTTPDQTKKLRTFFGKGYVRRSYADFL
ncbi:hypothetical protein P389DRAFT_83871 [Cystobasidium minutum MCA 4210]|uniref:uncharacterized protein n=1 Tax=Cystobasidium minutum MCA 4210 TaxID=1397322 RepID=UPI0034CEDEC6|eukprot:jgi/Rhomi1/83871/CE83870_86